LYETTDGCAHWHLIFTNRETTGFWDAIAFWNQQRGMLLGDPVNGRFVILRTNDGGRHWSQDKSAGLEADPPEKAPLRPATRRLRSVQTAWGRISSQAGRVDSGFYISNPEFAVSLAVGSRLDCRLRILPKLLGYSPSDFATRSTV
jgi:hypothetical protein